MKVSILHLGVRKLIPAAFSGYQVWQINREGLHSGIQIETLTFVFLITNYSVKGCIPSDNSVKFCIVGANSASDLCKSHKLLIM